MPTEPFDQYADTARNLSLTERPVEPMAAPFEMTPRWQALALPNGLHRGLCQTCLNSGFVHEIRDGRQGVVFYDGKLLRCDCKFGRKIDAQFAKSA